MTDKSNKMSYDDLRIHLMDELESLIDEINYEAKPCKRISNILALQKTNYEKLVEHLEDAIEKAHELHAMQRGKEIFDDYWKSTRGILKEFV